MAWVYLDDHFPEHPKVQAAGDEAGWLYVCALAYSQRNHTLGQVPKNAVGKLTGHRNPGQIAKRLVDAGLWHDKGDHYEIHDYEPWNQSAVKAANVRSEKARKAADKRWRDQQRSNAQASPEHPPSNAQASPEQSSSTAPAFPPRASDRLSPSPNPAITGTNTQSSSLLAETDDDDPEWTPEQQAWQDALSALADRETPDVVRREGPVKSRRHWLAAAYRNALDEQANHALGYIDQLTDEIDLAAAEGRTDIVTYLAQSQAAGQRRVAASRNLQTTLERCSTCHDRRIIDIDDHGAAVWCPNCRQETRT